MPNTIPTNNPSEVAEVNSWLFYEEEGKTTAERFISSRQTTRMEGNFALAIIFGPIFRRKTPSQMQYFISELIGGRQVLLKEKKTLK